MRKYFNNTIKIVIFILFVVSGIFVFNNDYTKHKEIKCVVLDKMTTTGGYKSSGQFYLILKEEGGIIFDIVASPSTFYKLKIGKTYYFNLRKFDFNQTPEENFLYFGTVLIFIFSMFFLFGLFISSIVLDD